MRRAAAKFALIATVASLLAGCAADAPVSDADKLARIHDMYENYRKDFPSVEGITARELEEHAGDDSVVLVDVRTPEEQTVSMIPGALTEQQFEADRAKYRDALVVTYCTIGARSGKYASQLAKDGFHVRNLEGSLLAWTFVGGALTGPDGPTRRVHVYGRQWNLVADGYDAVW